MKEYTITALCFVAATIVLDAATKIRLLGRKDYYAFLCTILVFKLLVNGYLTGQRIVVYGDTFYLGLRIGSIPLEDFLFGFSMVSMTIIFWEYCKEGLRKARPPSGIKD